MITGIAIENFKGIRERVEIELRPITMLFGPNSAGKSTILHALHYAREVFERHNLDADQTITGGHYVDLGGFRNFLHHTPTAISSSTAGNGGSGGSGTAQKGNIELKIGITLKLDDTDLPEMYDPGDYNSYDPQDSLFSGITKAHVEVTIIWSDLLNAPHVSEYSVNYNDKPFAKIVSQPGRQMAILETVDLEHPILIKRKDLDRFGNWDWDVPDVDEIDNGEYSGLKYLLNKVRRNAWVPVWEEDTYHFLETLPRQEDAIPTWGQRLSLYDWRDDGVSSEPLEPEDRVEMESDNQEINAVLSRLIVGPGELVRDALQQFRYLGPLRETPSREYSPPRFPDRARWATGLGAWDELQTGSEKLVQAVGDWLGEEDKLDSGYTIERRQLKEIDLADPLIRQLLTGRAFDEAEQDARINLDSFTSHTRLVIVPRDSDLDLRPHDVGIGVSQVVPVIVTALDGKGRLLAIEQPELHLHPKLQAELADLFIEAALGDPGHVVMLETHSELIPLRLMRRIRESRENDGKVERPSITSKDVAIVYVETHKGATITTPLELGIDGQLLDPWPNGFFEDGFRERFSK